MPLDTHQVEIAIRHLRSADQVLRSVIDKVGPCQLRRERNRLRALVRSIISQQISTSAARTIQQRVEALIAPQDFTAENLSKLTPRRLRSAGLSPQKAGYVFELAQQTAAGELRLNQLGRLSDEKVIQSLLKIKGIGRWTAQMFLISSLGRPDVLPYDDLGIRSAIRRQFHLKQLPDKSTCERIAQPWRPYTTVACWYLWRSIDLPSSETSTMD
ncbi:MAG: DNA-3-methyladenine glycosylase [Pirellulaceae bacterium]|nr:DNA-3-methyladenine glycosylase [Pirellulaceae bacterium]